MLSLDDKLALRKAINEIDFPEKEGKTLMDRLRETQDDDSLTKLHDEWRKFWKRRSMELHPDKTGSNEEFKAFQNKKDIIDKFFDEYTEFEGLNFKRKFKSDQDKNIFSTTIDHLSHNQSQNPNGQSQSSFQGEGSRASRANRYSKESNPPRNFSDYPSTSKSNFDFNSTKEDPRNQSQTTSQGGKQQQNSRDSGDSSFENQTRADYFSSRNEGSYRDGLSELDEILRAFIEQKSKQNSSSFKFSTQSDLSFKKNGDPKSSDKKQYLENLLNKNYGSSTQQDEKYHSQNHDNRSRGESRNFGDPTLVFYLTSAQGFGIIFIAQQNQRRDVEENHNGPSTFAGRFCHNNGGEGGYFR
jgi:hypothetical protein